MGRITQFFSYMSSYMHFILQINHSPKKREIQHKKRLFPYFFSKINHLSFPLLSNLYFTYVSLFIIYNFLREPLIFGGGTWPTRNCNIILRINDFWSIASSIINWLNVDNFGGEKKRKKRARLPPPAFIVTCLSVLGITSIWSSSVVSKFLQNIFPGRNFPVSLSKVLI